MFANATVTIKRPAVEYDQTTGYRKPLASPQTIVSGKPCVFSQSARGKRVVNADGLHEYGKPIHSVLLSGDPTLQIRVGDTAEVTPTGGSLIVFTVAHAIPSVGIRETVWHLDVERLEVPA